MLKVLKGAKTTKVGNYLAERQADRETDRQN